MADLSGSYQTNDSGYSNNFSNLETDVQISDAAYTTTTSQYGSAVGASYGGIVNYSETDQGAVSAGLALGQAAILSATSTSQKAVDAALLGIARSSDIVASKAESDITKVSKPLLWLALIIASVFIFFFWKRRKD